MYREITEKIEITVEPEFVREQSNPQAQYYFFSYRVKIKNLGDSPAQLISRHWIITDGAGQTRDVRGPGVVGEQPLLNPGQEYQYTSFCPLPTPTGNMRGTYRMQDESGDTFDVAIPLFFLRDPSTFN